MRVSLNLTAFSRQASRTHLGARLTEVAQAPRRGWPGYGVGRQPPPPWQPDGLAGWSDAGALRDAAAQCGGCCPDCRATHVDRDSHKLPPSVHDGTSALAHACRNGPHCWQQAILHDKWRG